MDEGIKEILEFNPDNSEDYYEIIGCDELSSTEQIIAEYRARVLNCHPDKHPNDPEKAKEFELLQTARDVLTDEQKRQNYDKWRHAGVAIPFKTWAGMRYTVHTSMHWASPKKEYMLEESGSSKTSSTGSSSEQIVMRSNLPSGDLDLLRTGADSKTNSVPWARDTPSEMLRKFRNYEI